jgi:uncharacterized protein (DUF433 family)
MKPTPTNAYMDGHIDITPGYSGGEPHIRDRRIKVRHIAVWHERMGMSPDKIVDEYGLTLADIYAALAYYFDHLEEIDQAIIDSDSFVEEMRKASPSLLRERLAALR